MLHAGRARYLPRPGPPRRGLPGLPLLQHRAAAAHPAAPRPAAHPARQPPTRRPRRRQPGRHRRPADHQQRGCHPHRTANGHQTPAPRGNRPAAPRAGSAHGETSSCAAASAQATTPGHERTRQQPPARPARHHPAVRCQDPVDTRQGRRHPPGPVRTRRHPRPAPRTRPPRAPAHHRSPRRGSHLAADRRPARLQRPPGRPATPPGDTHPRATVADAYATALTCENAVKICSNQR